MLVLLCLIGGMHITSVAQDNSEVKSKSEKSKKLKKKKLEELKEYKKKCLAEIKKHKGYTVILYELCNWTGETITAVKVMNGKIVSRKVYDGESEYKNKTPSVTEDQNNINKSEEGERARTMEQLITESESIIKNWDDYTYDLTVDIDGFELTCTIYPRGWLDVKSTGVTIEKIIWHD